MIVDESKDSLGDEVFLFQKTMKASPSSITLRPAIAELGCLSSSARILVRARKEACFFELQLVRCGGLVDPN